MTDVTEIEKPKTLMEAKNRGAGVPVAQSGGGFRVAFSDAGQVMEFAAAMAGAGVMVGPACRGNVGACMAVTMMAGRFGLDPFLLSHKAYITKSKSGVEVQSWEAQAIYAMLIGSGELDGLLEFEYRGEGVDRYIIVTGRLRGHTKSQSIQSSPIKQIPVKNSPNWTGEPDQQLAYYGSRLWARRHAPHILMGVYSRDEAEEMVNVTPAKNDDPAARLSASIERSSQERAETEAAKAEEPAPADPEPQDAEFEEAQPAATESEVLDAMQDELERKPEPEQPASQGDLLGDEPATDANGAKLKQPAPEGQTSAAKAVDDALDAATSPVVKEPNQTIIQTAAGAEAWAESWAAWYKSLTKAERADVTIGGKFDQQINLAAKITDAAAEIINDAMNSPASDEEV